MKGSETKIAEIEAQMNDEKKIAADYNAMQALSGRHETLSQVLETTFEAWSAFRMRKFHKNNKKMAQFTLCIDRKTLYNVT